MEQMAPASIEAVWGYRVELDGAPIYFGIGSRRRPEHVRRGSHNRALRLLAQKGADLNVVMTDRPFATRADAQEWERDMIAFFGRRDLGQGLLFNFTDGGDGLSSADASRINRERAATGAHPFQRSDARAACSERMSLLAQQRNGELVKAGAHQFQGDRNPMRRRKAAGVKHHSQLWKPWDRPQTTAASAAAWAMAAELHEFFLVHRHKHRIPWSSIPKVPSRDAIQTIARWFRTGWEPALDLDWREWARAYRATTQTGDLPNGANPSGS